jgi:hypothetical protein
VLELNRQNLVRLYYEQPKPVEDELRKFSSLERNSGFKKTFIYRTLKIITGQIESGNAKTQY